MHDKKIAFLPLSLNHPDSQAGGNQFVFPARNILCLYQHMAYNRQLQYSLEICNNRKLNSYAIFTISTIK